MTQGMGSLIDSLEPGARSQKFGVGDWEGGFLMSWPDVADPCHSAEREACARVCQDDGAEAFAAAG